MTIHSALLFDLHPSVLRSFLAVASTLSFTKAGMQLDLGQSTISQHIKKLEKAVGHGILIRDTHSVALTDEGEVLVEIIRGILDGYERLGTFVRSEDRRPRLRLGISEDFAMSRLENVLVAFRSSETRVDIELTVGLSGYLYRCFDSGDLDVILAKRKPGDRRGKTAWREPLVWIGRPGVQVPKGRPVPLVTYSPPSITRSLAIEALQKADRPWRISCSSGSLNGLRAALVAGLGVAAHSRRLIPSGLGTVPADSGLPDLPWTEFVVLGPGQTHPLAMRMVDLLVENAAASVA
jgi:DNA-binding transcriptional LysR family regulator